MGHRLLAVEESLLERLHICLELRVQLIEWPSNQIRIVVRRSSHGAAVSLSETLL